MHIPDGFLSAPVSLASALLSSAAVGLAARRARGAQGGVVGARAVSRLGVTAAFVFAAQTLNFPVAGGTSGHLIGGVLAAILLGPSTAVVAMTAVLVLQCLVLGDGGLLALGANALNMAVVQPLVGFAIYRILTSRPAPGSRFGDARRISSAAFAAWVATTVAAAACAGEIGLSGIVAPAVVVAAMVGVHAVIGIGEALITALVLAAVLRVRPELLTYEPASPTSTRASSAALALIACVALALFVSPFACAWPDGLQRVVEHLGLRPSHLQLNPRSLLAIHWIPAVAGSPVGASIVLAAGTLLAFALCCGIGFWLAPRSVARAPSASRT